MLLGLVEVPDVGGSHLQRGNEVRVHLGQALGHLFLAHQQIVQHHMVELFRIAVQGLIALGPHVGNDAIHHGLHIRLGADVPVQDLLGPQLVELIQLDHCSVPSCSFSIRVRSSLFLNL